ncbi:MAG: hypothetical protein Q8S73_36880 [Deltaproteobacteria bacterium]|nr:hypothetical protein [Myxococcales bacterium]MDP3219735.1 hypothetical protein [Deltaproteobacteria bacterium]
MLGPLRLPAPSQIKPATNRAGATIPTNRLVGYGTATGNESAIDSLDVAGLGKLAGAIQHAVDNGDTIDVFDGGELVLESDGTAIIPPNTLVIAVAGASLSASGRVTRLPASPTPGTNYEVVGRSLNTANIAATAGLPVPTRWHRYTYQG